MKTQAHPPPPPPLFGRLHNWVDPGFVMYILLHTHTHTLDYSVSQGEDVVPWGELEVEEVTDARSGSFTVLITVTPTFKPSSQSWTTQNFLQMIFFLSHRIRKVWQKRKCGVKFGCLTISHSTVRMCGPVLATRLVKSSNRSQHRSVYILQNTRSIFRLIAPRQSWTYWPVRCDRTLRTRRPLTWSQVGSFVMSEPWHFPLCIASLKRHLGCRCMRFFPPLTFSPLIE